MPKNTKKTSFPSPPKHAASVRGIKDVIAMLIKNENFLEQVGIFDEAKPALEDWDQATDEIQDKFVMSWSECVNRDFADDLGEILKNTDADGPWNLSQLELAFRYNNHKDEGSDESRAWIDLEQGIFLGLSTSCGAYYDENYDASATLHIEVNKTQEQILQLVENLVMEKVGDFVSTFDESMKSLEGSIGNQATKNVFLDKARLIMEGSQFLSKAVAASNNVYMNKAVENVTLPNKPSKPSSKM